MENGHTFTSDELGLDEEVGAGEDGKIEITFPESGEVMLFCRFHADQGMRGALEVA